LLPILNSKVVQIIKNQGSKVLVVTKYFDKATTYQILKGLEKGTWFFGIGENRINDLKKKKLPKEKTHFIGRIQSNKIKDIVKYCSVIHSLDKIKHAKKINELALDKIGVFIQINISDEQQKGGVLPKDFKKFLNEIKGLKKLKVLGISGMGRQEFTEKEKRQEFALLKDLRRKYLQGKKISAGTSCDYKIAIDEGIDILRIGSALFK
jgi:uncharacterized pyridoxal phosphate-containing UPF0001 family protein